MIVRENHNLDNISLGADADASIDSAIRSSLGIWDAREMGISAEEVQRRFDAANTPEARRQLLSDLRARAIERASLDVTTGRVAYAGIDGNDWHSLGTIVDSAMTAKEAITLAALDYRVNKEPVMVAVGGQLVPVDNVFAMVRVDADGTARPFDGVSVSSDYKVIQNAECFEFMDEVLGAVDGAHYESAGAIDGGRKIWLQATMPDWAEPVLGDVVHSKVLFTNSHDSTESAWIFGTDHRVCCKNTRRQALGGRHSGIRLRHTGNIKRKIREAQHALGLARNAFSQFREQIAEFPRVKVNPEWFINGVFDQCISHVGISHAEASLGVDALVARLDFGTQEERTVAERRYRRLIKRRDRIVSDTMNRYESATNTSPGTLWSAYNAVTEYANHSLKYKGSQTKRAESKLDSVLMGRADRINRNAMSHALEVCATA